MRGVARRLFILMTLLATANCSATNKPSGSESPNGVSETILSNEIEGAQARVPARLSILVPALQPKLYGPQYQRVLPAQLP